jgi:predicted kinase
MAEVGRSHIPGERPISLFMLVGIPGSGKSTWAKAFLKEHPNYQLVSTDQIRAHLYGDEATQGNWPQVWQQVLAQWQSGIDQVHRGTLAGVIYDATNTRRRHRRQAIDTAKTLGFNTITLVWFDLPLAVCLGRNRERSRQVPPEVLVKMHRQLRGAPPSEGEKVDRVLRITTAETR